MKTAFLEELESKMNFEVIRFRELHGGSINEVLLLETSRGKQVIKINDPERYPGMFESEKQGLETLLQAGSIPVPEPGVVDRIGGKAFLSMEYIEEGRRNPDFWETFGRGLANLHRITASQFGYHQDNYIGSLPQYNHPCSTAEEFFLSQRLEPQLKTARDKGFSFSNLGKTLRNLAQEIPPEPPALIHGDLWNGNYLIDRQGSPVLIDPAVAYASREMDLAMMNLFGGFPMEVFHSYEESFPLEPGFQSRMQIWQLYYLLVHLNIFGSGYYQQVKRILDQFA